MTATVEQTEKLSALELFITQKDAIMEPKIADVLRQYIADGGNPRFVVEQLSDNYAGYAAMAELVVSWNKMLDRMKPPVGTGPPARDEAHFLRELAKERFDPESFTGIFSGAGSRPPKWLDGIISDPQLIYELSAVHKNSLLLNFAIQKILRAGHEDEVASVGSSLASYFGVYHRLMCNRLKEVSRAQPARLRVLLAELKDSPGGSLKRMTLRCNLTSKETAVSGQHTYCHAQQVLGRIGRGRRGARYRRISQELFAAAAEQHGPIVYQMQTWLLSKKAPAADVEAAEKILELYTASAGSSKATEAISSLSALYSQPNPPTLGLIRQPKVMELLIARLFAPGQRLPTEESQPALRLLTIAAAALDQRPEGGLDTSEVPEVERVVRDSMALCRSAIAGAKLGNAERERAEGIAQVAVAAAGALHSMQVQLAVADFWRETLHTSGAHIFIYLLGLIIECQPRLQEKAVGVVEGALVAMGNKELALQKAMVDCGVRLLLAGHVDACLGMAERWSRSGPIRRPPLCPPPPHHLRTPYSPTFARALFRLMQTSGVRRHRIQQQDGISLEQLDEFVAACAELDGFQANFTPGERSYFAALQA